MATGGISFVYSLDESVISSSRGFTDHFVLRRNSDRFKSLVASVIDILDRNEEMNFLVIYDKTGDFLRRHRLD